MGPVTSFNQQFFAVSSTIRDGKVLLAGGLYPLSGSRSAYRASVACYDYAAQSVAWLCENSKNYPYRAIAHGGGVCGVLIDQNFVRCPTGLFRFDLESGEPLEPACEVVGCKINCVSAADEAFFFAWVAQETSRMRIVSARDGVFRERSFPYRSTAGGKTIERVLATGNESFVGVFSLVGGERIVYSVEAWKLDSAAPNWERQTRLKHAVRNESALLLWDGSRPRLEVEILALESGEVEKAFRLALTDVVAIEPIAAETYAVLSISGVYVLDAAAQTLSSLWDMKPSELLDFGALAVDCAQDKLIVVTAGNHQRPGTRLTVLEL